MESVNKERSPLFEDDPTFVPPEDAIECRHRGYSYYRDQKDGVWKRRLAIRIWCDICKKESTGCCEVW